MTAWSYSAIKTFEQCPKKYYHTRVAKDVVEPTTEALDYGNEVHKAAEDFFKSGTPIPKKFAFMQGIVTALAAFPGEKHAELKLGVRRTDTDYEACDFFAPDVWYRGIADLLCIDEAGERAWCVDYKTGKNARYADLRQLDLLAGAVFVRFPQIRRIRSALLYVVSNEFISKDHVVGKRDVYLGTFKAQLDRRDGAHASGVWNASPSPLCGWCPVVDCAHHKPRRQ